jgi:MoaA/NifB/PqqE/SkfB family radical SAM enzyme
VFRKNKINMIQICANAGEALYHPDLLEILEVAIEESNGVEFNTNGAVHCQEWWSDLGRLLNRPKDIVIFAIDGLTGVHEIHRSWPFETVFNNMVSFIKGGGNAGWQFIVFKHNEHQLHLCEKLAKDIGVKRFVIRNSRDYDEEYPAPTIMNCNKDRTTLFNTDYEKDIRCWAEPPNNLLFIDFRGRFWPCPAIPGVYMLKDIMSNKPGPNFSKQALSDKILELIEEEFDGILSLYNQQDLTKIQNESKLWEYLRMNTNVESVCDCYCNENRKLFGDRTKNFHRIIEF